MHSSNPNNKTQQQLRIIIRNNNINFKILIILYPTLIIITLFFFVLFSLFFLIFFPISNQIQQKIVSIFFSENFLQPNPTKMQSVPLGEIPITKTKAYSIEKEMRAFLNNTTQNLFWNTFFFPQSKKKKSIKKKEKQTLKQKIKKRIPFPSKTPPKINFHKI